MWVEPQGPQQEAEFPQKSHCLKKGKRNLPTHLPSSRQWKVRPPRALKSSMRGPPPLDQPHETCAGEGRQQDRSGGMPSPAGEAKWVTSAQRAGENSEDNGTAPACPVPQKGQLSTPGVSRPLPTWEKAHFPHQSPCDSTGDTKSQIPK